MKYYSTLNNLETALIDLDGLAPILYAVATSAQEMTHDELQSALHRIESLLRSGLENANDRFQEVFSEIRDDTHEPPTKKGKK